MVKLRLLVVLEFLLVGVLFTSFLEENPPLKYMQVATIKSSIVEEDPIATRYEDTLSIEPIYLRNLISMALVLSFFYYIESYESSS